MKVVYLRGALRDLEDIRTFIAQSDPEAGKRVVAPIGPATARLENFPYSGTPGPRDVRLLSVPGLPYVVIHRVVDDLVRVVAVFHTSRNRRFR